MLTESRNRPGWQAHVWPRGRWLPVLVSALALTSMAAAGTELPLPSYRPNPSIAGEVRCAGAETMRGLIEGWSRELGKRSPGVHVRVDVTTKLASEGFSALLEGRADCATFVREPFPSELDAFEKKFGYAPGLIAVANGSYDTKGGTHAIAIYVNAANPLRRLDLRQLDAIFSETFRRGAKRQLATWGDLGLPEPWTERPIHVYGMVRSRGSGNPPGIVNFLSRRILLGGAFRDDLREQTDAPGESALQAIVNRVADDPDGIGYSGFGFARPGVEKVAIGETSQGPFYIGDLEEVRSRRYPLSREIYILINRRPGQPMPAELRELLLLALSQEGQDIVAGDSMRFLPLSANDAEESRKALQ